MTANSNSMAAAALLVMLGFPQTPAAAEPTETTATVGTAADAAESREESRRRGDAYAHLMRSLFSIRHGEYGSAVEEIHGALALQPESPDLLIESARLLLLMHRDSEAERLARRALTFDGEHHDAMLFLADMSAERAFRSQSDRKSREEAIRLYRKIIDSEADLDPDMLRRLTQLEHESGNLAGAIEVARLLAEQRPGDRRGAITLAELLLQDGQREEALRGLLRYVADHPFDDELIRWARDLVDRLAGWQLVDEVMSPRAPFAPDSLQVNLLYAEGLLRVHKREEAVAVLERLRDARPHDDAVRRQLVFAYRAVRRMADAAMTIHELLEADPQDPYHYVLLADTLFNQGDRSGAYDAYEKAIRGFGDDPERIEDRDAFRQRMVLIKLALDEPEEARRVLDQMERQDGPLALEARVRVAIHEKSWSEARQAAKKIRATGADQAGYAAMLEGEIAVGEKRWSEAGKRFAEAAKQLGPVVRARIAETYREGGRPEIGAQILRDWVEDEPDDADARYQLGAYLYLLDRFDEAEREMREALRLNPEHAAALNFLGYSLAERDERLDEALELVQQALEIDAWNGAFLDSLGWVYFQMGDYAAARGPLERAARELPSDPTVLEHLGDVYQRLGEFSLALAAWDRAYSEGPEDPEALLLKIERQREQLDARAAEEARAETRGTPAPQPLPR